MGTAAKFLGGEFGEPALGFGFPTADVQSITLTGRQPCATANYELSVRIGVVSMYPGGGFAPGQRTVRGVPLKQAVPHVPTQPREIRSAA